ncbi:MAG: MFS transporter [Rhodospirillales bacterium]|nr:MFS transporter [Rhodospirillales bacterium]MDP6643727.1 MFS transporter [Rhodospirillales bacterium]MDP6841214.1 MFS transporter [Rhodospirillales bacterium]
MTTQSDANPADRRQVTGGAAFRHADFRNFFLARSVSRLAVEMQVTAIGWQVYNMTGKAFDLGLIGLALILPFLILFPAAGLAADRFPRSRIITVCLSVEAVCALIFLVLTATGEITFPLILATLALFGLSRTFQTPAEQAIVPILVPKEAFSNAIAWSSAGSYVARIAGPGIAGLMIIAGEQWVYGAVFVAIVAAAVFATLIRVNTQIIASEPLNFATVFAGLRFISKRQIMMGAISLDMFAVFLGGAVALLPIYAKDILAVGPEGFGALRAAITIGALSGAVYFTRRPIRRGAGRKLLSTVALFGLATVVFGISESFWLSLFMLYAMGVFDSVSVFIRTTLVQIVAPDQLRGRVNAVNSVFIGASNELGEFESGVTAAWWGTVPAVIVGGIGTICVALVFARIFPQLRGADSLDPDDLVRKYQ